MTESDLEYTLKTIHRLLSSHEPDEIIVRKAYTFVSDMAQEIGLNLHWEGEDK